MSVNYPKSAGTGEPTRIRKAVDSDLPMLWAVLRQRQATSMFLSSNLQDHGLNTFGHSNATTLWVAENQSGIQAIFGCTRRGYLLCQTPEFDPGWSGDLIKALAGRMIAGMTGEAGQITNLRRTLGLENVAVSFEDTEPLFQLQMDDLIVPGGLTDLRTMTNADLPLVTDWRLAFDRECFDKDDNPALRAQSNTRALDLIRSGRGRLLELDGTPVAMTAFNAALPDIVQIGSVYTPPALRSRGFARRAVALHLKEARGTGVGAAVLFALGEAAIRAYESIGFTRIGDYLHIDFAQPTRIGDPA